MNYAEFERFEFISRAMLGRVSGEEVERWHHTNPGLAIAASNMCVALSTDDDDLAVQAGDAMWEMLPIELISADIRPRRVR